MPATVRLEKHVASVMEAEPTVVRSAARPAVADIPARIGERRRNPMPLVTDLVLSTRETRRQVLLPIPLRSSLELSSKPRDKLRKGRSSTQRAVMPLKLHPAIMILISW